MLRRVLMPVVTVAAAVSFVPASAAWAAGFSEEPGSPHAVGNDPYGVVTADFNRDGRPDVAVVNGTSSSVSMLLRRPGGGFTAESPVAVGGGPNHAVVGDFNADGFPDVAVSSFAGDSVTVLLRRAAGGFVPAPGSPVGVPSGPSAIAAGDFNGDGKADLAVTRLDANAIRVLLADPLVPGRFVQGGDVATGVRPHHVASGDLNGDGRLDLAVANNGPVASTAPDSVSILLGQPGGGFAPEAAMPVVPVGDRPLGVAARDLNGDGRLDLAVSNHGSATVSVLLRRPANDGFAPEGGTPIEVGAGPVGVASADFDGDGRNDLAVASNEGGAVTVLRRAAAGGFVREPPLPVPRAYWLVPSDFTGDGRADLAVTTDQPGRVRIFVNTFRASAPTPTPTPTAAPPPPLDLPRNVSAPSVRATQVARLYVCDEGAWLNLPPNPQFEYRWYHAWSRAFRPTLVSQGRGYLLPRERIGSTFYCVVTARTPAGATSASSRWTILSGAPAVAPIVRPAPYGNVRIRGIDVFQTVQPSSGAQMFGFPLGGFPALPGGGTPTNYRQQGIFGPQLQPGADQQRVAYAGVPLDADKPATAVVYVNMSDRVARSVDQPLEVTLTFRLDGRKQAWTLIQTLRNPPLSGWPFVTLPERDDPKFGVQFAIPAALMSLAANAGEVDVEADVAFPLSSQIRGTRECDAGDCLADNRFRLDGVPVARLPRLTMQSLALRVPGQGNSLSPEWTLAPAKRLFPGGSTLSILPYAAVLDIGVPAGLTLNDRACTDLGFDRIEDADADDQVRACRQYHVSQAVEQWYWRNAPERQSYDLLFAAHNYPLPSGNAETGWKWGPGLDAGPRGVPKKFAANDGSAGRRYTAAAHELGHVMSAPHTQEPSPGACDEPARPEPWEPDRAGRLQGVGFGRASTTTVAGRVDPAVDTEAIPLYDVMSYCAAESNAWLSARNWNRAFRVLQDFDARRRQPQAAVSRSAAPLERQSVAIGILGPAGGRIDRVLPPEGRVPPPEPQSSVRLRAFASDGTLLRETGVRAHGLSEDAGAGILFAGPVPARAASVELLRGGHELHRVERSRPPRVRVTAPRRGTRATVRSSLPVRWTASDPDGDVLQAVVDFAADGDRRWRTVYQGPSTGRARISGRLLEAGSRARVRVTVSDRFNSARAVSRPFRAQGTAPVVDIARPAPGEPLRAGERTLLAGAGFDDGRRPLRGRSLSWYVGGRRIASGERAGARLPAGRVTLRLVARDRRGRPAVARRVLRVARRPLQLRTMRAPERVRPRTRRATFAIRTSGPATLRVGGRRHRVGARLRRITIPLPRRPKAGLVRIPFTIKAKGRTFGGRIRGELQILRV